MPMTAANWQPAADPGALAVLRSLETRFGTIAVDPDAVLRVPQGILGFAHYREFVLADMPDARLARFKLMQSTEDADLSFIVLPLDPAAGLIAEADLEEARAGFGVPAADAIFLLMVTVRKAETGIAMTVNLRAPVLVDTGRRIARQCVLSSNAYPIRHQL